MTPQNLHDYALYCSSGTAAVGIGKLLNFFPDTQSVVTTAVLALIGAFVGGSVKLMFDVFRASKLGKRLGIKK